VKVARRDVGAASVLSLTGRLAGEPDYRVLDAHIAALLAEGRLDVLLDLAGLAWVNSTGLGALVAAFDAVRRRGGRLKLCAVNDRVDDVLGGCGLYSMFEVHRTEEAALASLLSPGGAPAENRP
jgi:anti-sigma B factor antagonist